MSTKNLLRQLKCGKAYARRIKKEEDRDMVISCLELLIDEVVRIVKEEEPIRIPKPPKPPKPVWNGIRHTSLPDEISQAMFLNYLCAKQQEAPNNPFCSS